MEKVTVNVFKTPTGYCAGIDILPGWIATAKDHFSSLTKMVEDGIQFYIDCAKADNESYPEVFDREYKLEYKTVMLFKLWIDFFTRAVSASNYKSSMGYYTYLIKPGVTYLSDSIFAGKCAVISGITYASRDDIAKVITLLGGRTVSAISNLTDFFITGGSPVPKKLEKVEEMQAAGHYIRRIKEDELMELLGDYFEKKDL